jgi:hypothetical protein
LIYIALLEETDEYWLLAFLPQGDGKIKDIMCSLVGRIKIEKSKRTLKHIAFKCNKPFKPNFTTRIYRFNMKFNYERVTEEGPLLISSMDFDIHLKTVGVFNLDEKVTVEISEYAFVGDDATHNK